MTSKQKLWIAYAKKRGVDLTENDIPEDGPFVLIGPRTQELGDGVYHWSLENEDRGYRVPSNETLR